MKLPSIFRRKVEKRYDETSDFWYYPVAIPSLTGVDISESTSLKNATVWGCVRVISESVASLPLFVYRRLADGGKEKAPNHPLYRLLHERPNSEMTSFQLREIMMEHLLLWGNFYGQLDWARNNVLMNIWPLRPDRMEMQRGDNTLIKYVYRPTDGGGEIEFDPEDILHIPGLGFNGISGYSVIAMAREAVGIGVAAEELTARFFSNDATPVSVLTHPGHLTEDAHKRLKSSWGEVHGGLKNKWKPAVLEEGLDVKTLGMTLVDAQFIETRKFSVTEICRFFRVPPHMVQDLERATFSNIEEQSLGFVRDCIRPWLVRLEQAYKFKLFLDVTSREFFPEHVVEGLLRGDIQSRYNAYAIGRQWGWLSANDIRELENMNPIEGGDIYLVPMNMSPSDKVEEIADAQINKPEPKQISGGNGEDKTISDEEMQKQMDSLNTENLQLRKQLNGMKQDGFKRLFSDAVGRIVRRESIAIKRGLQRRDLQGFTDYMEEFYHDLPNYMTNALHPCLSSYAQLVDSTAATKCLTSFIDGHIKESKNDLEQWAGVYIHDSTDFLRQNRDAIDDCLSLWMDTRPEAAAQSFVNFFSTS